MKDETRYNIFMTGIFVIPLLTVGANGFLVRLGLPDFLGVIWSFILIWPALAWFAGVHAICTWDNPENERDRMDEAIRQGGDSDSNAFEPDDDGKMTDDIEQMSDDIEQMSEDELRLARWEIWAEQTWRKDDEGQGTDEPDEEESSR